MFMKGQEAILEENEAVEDPNPDLVVEEGQIGANGNLSKEPGFYTSTLYTHFMPVYQNNGIYEAMEFQNASVTLSCFKAAQY